LSFHQLAIFPNAYLILVVVSEEKIQLKPKSIKSAFNKIYGAWSFHQLAIFPNAYLILVRFSEENTV
jgi:hypothetical protein